jgi:hypothetical protein
MADSVYLETSVLSALFDLRSDPVCQVQHQETKEWHEREGRYYDLYVSALVLDELRGGKYDHQQEAVSFARGLSLLSIDDEVLGVARVYADHLVMPQDNLGDAVHLAVASVNEVDYLLTWNCKHLANPNKVRRIAEINRRLGLMVPVIATPAMLYREDES